LRTQRAESLKSLVQGFALQTDNPPGKPSPQRGASLIYRFIVCFFHLLSVIAESAAPKQHVIVRNEMTKQTREIVNENNHKEYWIASG
jgi:hypothetical protein